MTGNKYNTIKEAQHMTVNNRIYFFEGRDYWYQYLKVNGDAFRPNEDGLKKLSKNIDINVPYLRKCINIILES